MPEICRFYGIVIQMFYNEHNPPQFHATYGEYRATIDIQNIALLTGEFPNNGLKLVLNWTELHQMELMYLWDLARKEQKLFGIEPLE